MISHRWVDSKQSFELVSKLVRHGAIEEEVECRIAREQQMRDEANDQNPQRHSSAAMKVILLFLLECQRFMKTEKIAQNVTNEKQNDDGK